MLIDLERNDLGRICDAGSIVEVRDFMTVETYAHVHHLVSEVAGTLRPDVTPIEVLRAVFPGGTITGCPKVRCMQLIAAIEAAAGVARIPARSDMHRSRWLRADFNILIRTLTRVADRLTLRAGAGIVADSVPDRELEETRAKARGVLAALGVGRRRSERLLDRRASRRTSVPVDDRGLLYGDGLFETIACADGAPRFLDLHLQRLQDGCRALDPRLARPRAACARNPRVGASLQAGRRRRPASCA